MPPDMTGEFKKRWSGWFGSLGTIECGPGWRNHLWALCEDIEVLLRDGGGCDSPFAVFQVKEKFGGLRFYVASTTNPVHERIDRAEQESFNVCEQCGNTEGVTLEPTGSGWLKTLCLRCRDAL